MDDNFYPLSLYKAGSEFVWDGVGTDRLEVNDADEHAEAVKAGWAEAADYCIGEADLLDGNASEIEQALPGLSDDELMAAFDGEKAGKARKGVLAAIESEIAKR